MYCTRCNERLIVHADETVACVCGELWRAGDAIPGSWQMSTDVKATSANLKALAQELS